MIAISWMAFGIGLLAGSAAGVVFFLGLALGIRLAIGASRPKLFLVLSALFRMPALLGAGWLVADHGGAIMLIGFALAFVMVRLVAVTIARTHKSMQVPLWN